MPQKALSQLQIDAVLKLDGPARYSHFIKQAAAWRCVWGLWCDGWAGVNSEGFDALPLWPARDYAKLCAVGEWASYEPRKLNLQHLLGEMIPAIDDQGDKICVFPTPAGTGVFLDSKQVADDLRRELKKY